LALILLNRVAGADETADKLKRHHRRLSVSQCCIRTGCGFPPQSDWPGPLCPFL